MKAVVENMIKRSGRSWWQARYRDGKVLSEWETTTDKILLPAGKGSTSRWEEVPKEGMVSLRLLCPNGMAGELEAPEGKRFFQLKLGGTSVTMSLGRKIKNVDGHFQDAHIIGVVEDITGECLCRAWETTVEIDEKGKTTETVPPGATYLRDDSKNWQNINGRDPLLGRTIHIQGQLKYQERIIWSAHGNELRILPAPSPAWETYLPNGKEYFITSPYRRLVEFRDNIYNMKYRGIGRLNLDVQGMSS